MACNNLVIMSLSQIKTSGYGWPTWSISLMANDANEQNLSCKPGRGGGEGGGALKIVEAPLQTKFASFSLHNDPSFFLHSESTKRIGWDTSSNLSSFVSSLSEPRKKVNGHYTLLQRKFWFPIFFAAGHYNFAMYISYYLLISIIWTDYQK